MVQIQSYLLCKIIAIALFSLISLNFINNAFAAPNEFELYSVNAKPYNSSFVEWTTKWWQWVLAIPQNENPTNDPSGKFCSTNQSGPVWYLAGTLGGDQERECTIPSSKAILIPIVNVECSSQEELTASIEHLNGCAKEFIDTYKIAIGNLIFKIDDNEIRNLSSFRIHSHLFNVTYGEPPLYAPIDRSQPPYAISDGYWIFLKPLPVGNHRIELSALNTDQLKTTSGEAFQTGVKYNLHVTG
jgi:hypothetical protein